MGHLLDNPVWAALTSGNRNLSGGNDIARYLDPEVSAFSAIKEPTPKSYRALYDMVPFQGPVGIFTKEKAISPSPWKIIKRIDGFQMVYTKTEVPQFPGKEIVQLDKQHVPEMLALTKMTNPGPFLSGTIRFGNYEGILLGGRLVAMAGQRLHSGNYVEISAVCTHPDHVGKGYARQLILSQISNIHANGEIPYLHVRADNTRAIEIYHAMGFETRSGMNIYLMEES